jgi:zinc protease
MDRRAQVSNTVWLNTLAAAERDPRALALAMHTISDLQSLTADDIQSAARRWLIKAKSWRAEVLPESQRLAEMSADSAP